MNTKSALKRNESPSPRGNTAADDIEFGDREFNQVREIIRDMTGISMGASKRQLLYRRLITRLKARDIASVPAYLDLLRSGDATEVEQFTNAVTTNLTSFFRENHHFEYLAQTILPSIASAKSERRLRIWSAGCSTGEEPYSLAMTLHETMSDLPAWDAKILCTDLDTNVIATAAAGSYAEDRVGKVPPALVKKWFKADADRYHANVALKKLLTFKQLNLMGQWPMRGKFDVIFCRNVIIYFDKPTQRVLIDRYANILEEGGHLILGHSESLFKVSDRFDLIGKTIYRKKD